MTRFHLSILGDETFLNDKGNFAPYNESQIFIHKQETLYKEGST